MKKIFNKINNWYNERFHPVLVEVEDVVSCEYLQFETREEILPRLKAYRSILKDNPNSNLAKRNVSVLLKILGQRARKDGDIRLAKKSYNESLKIRRSLADAEPNNHEAKYDIINILCPLGLLTNDMEYFYEAIGIDEALLLKGQKDPKYSFLGNQIRQQCGLPSVIGIDRDGAYTMLRYEDGTQDRGIKDRLDKL